MLRVEHQATFIVGHELIVAITSHYVDNNFILQEDLLDFSEVDMCHNEINLAEYIYKVLFQYEIYQKLFCITTDNASNNDTTCEELSDLLYDSHQIDWDPKKHHIACLAHVINLAVQSFLKNIKVAQMTEVEIFALPSAAPAQLPVVPSESSKQRPRSSSAKGKASLKVKGTPSTEAAPSINDFGSTIKKLRKISAAINFPRSRTRDFWMFCKAKNLKQMKAVHDNDTRWNGTCCMIERAVYLQEAINPWVQSRLELKEFALSNREWELAEFLLRFLEPFRHATNSIQATGRPTLHQTFIMYEKLFNNLDNVKAIFEKMEAVPEWFEEVRNAINSMWTKLKDYYTKTKHPSAYVDANILHPAKKLSLFKKKDSSFADIPGQAGIYEAQARERFETIYNTQAATSVDELNPRKRKRMSDDPDYKSETSSDDDTFDYNEFDHFLRTKRDKTVRDGLVWWRSSHGMFPKTSLWYRDVAAVPASGAGVEREFSISGNVATKKRNRLTAKTISDTMIYKRWCARRGNPIPDIMEVVMLEEYEENDSDVESEFDERNYELEAWLAVWMEKKDLGMAAEQLFSEEL